MKIEIISKVGIKVDGNQITLGDTIESAMDILGIADNYENEYYFFEGALLICVNGDGYVEEIEVRNDEEQDMCVLFQEMEIFKQEKNAVLEYMVACNGDTLFVEEGAFCAKNLGVVFSFDLSEEEVEELIREAKADGVYEEMLDEIEKDVYRSKHVGAVLIKRDGRI